jgi:hypothetical protein
MFRLECYRKPGCSLCQETDDALRELQAELPFSFTWHNIFECPTWYEKYRHRVPVVVIEGVVVLELRFSAGELRAQLERLILRGST